MTKNVVSYIIFSDEYNSIKTHNIQFMFIKNTNYNKLTFCSVNQGFIHYHFICLFYYKLRISIHFEGFHHIHNNQHLNKLFQFNYYSSILFFILLPPSLIISQL